MKKGRSDGLSLLRWGYKKTVTFPSVCLSVSLRVLILGKPAVRSWWDKKLIRSSNSQWSLPTGTWVSLEAQESLEMTVALTKTWRAKVRESWGWGTQLSCTQILTAETEIICCLKVPSFELICYAVIDTLIHHMKIGIIKLAGLPANVLPYWDKCYY